MVAQRPIPCACPTASPRCMRSISDRLEKKRTSRTVSSLTSSRRCVRLERRPVMILPRKDVRLLESKEAFYSSSESPKVSNVSTMPNLRSSMDCSLTPNSIPAGGSGNHASVGTSSSRTAQETVVGLNFLSSRTELSKECHAKLSSRVIDPAVAICRNDRPLESTNSPCDP